MFVYGILFISEPDIKSLPEQNKFKFFFTEKVKVNFFGEIPFKR